MLDTNVPDILADDPRWAGLAARAKAAGVACFLVTRVQLDEIARVPDPLRRSSLQASFEQIGAVLIPTAGAVWDVSRWDMATYATEETGGGIDSHRGGGFRHKQDALIASTASACGAILVTAETRTDAFTRSFPGLVVWSPDGLARFLLSVDVGPDSG